MEIRGSQNTLIIAVDIGKIRNCACFVSSSGKVLRRRFFFTNTIDGFNQLMRQSKFYQRKEELPHTLFGMEPSGYYWIHLYEHLRNCGKRIVAVSPLAVNRNRETINVSKDKSDPKDAYGEKTLWFYLWSTAQRKSFFKSSKEQFISLKNILIFYSL